LIFAGIKACLDKKDDEIMHEKIKEKVEVVKRKIEEKTLFSYLANCFS